MNSTTLILVAGFFVIVLAGYAAYSLGHRRPPDSGSAVDLGAVGNLIKFGAKL